MIATQQETTFEPEDAATYLKVSKKTIYEWSKPVTVKGEMKSFWLESFRDGTRWRTTKEACDRFRAKCSQRQIQDQFRMSMPLSQVDQANRIAQASHRTKEKHGI